MTAMTSEMKRNLIIYGGAGVVILLAAGVASYLISSQREIAITNATITAPLIALSPTTAGRLNAVYVNPGDTLAAGAPVALVGTEVVEAKVAGLVVGTNDTVGAEIAPGATVVTMVDPTQLRVVGRIDENKGLARIHVGDPATFTVDAYGARRFTGVVDEVAATANASGVVFDISSQRETEQFDVKARFDTSQYPYLKNGMSARLYVYPQ